MPPSFFAGFAHGNHKAVANARHVLPVEHLLVHKEVKKIYTFCQSGRTMSLRNLFQILQNLDASINDGAGKE
jgi:hypothetical protein